MTNTAYETYQSPFSWRYASPQMRKIWSEVNKRLLWRKLWLLLAKTQMEYGLVTEEQVRDLEDHVEKIDIERSLQHETKTQHDLVAEIKTYAEQCPIAGGIIHLGATSMDIKDNAEIIQIRQALDIILSKLKDLLLEFVLKIETYADLPCIAFTHLQPAEPTTLGYRFAAYAQDLLMDWQAVKDIRDNLRAKGFKGAVGTASSYCELIGHQNIDDFEEKISAFMDVIFFPVSTQTYPRKQDLSIINALAGLGASLYKIAFDMRLLQSQPIAELQEPFSDKQVGSSAMPFKRNPIKGEKIDSLARSLAQMPQIAWHNAAHSLLERTLDDSANRRTILPEAFLICDELIITSLEIFKGLVVNLKTIERNLSIYAPFANTEKLLMALTKAGANRQDMHSILREHSLVCWKLMEEGKPQNLIESLAKDDAITQYLPESMINNIMNSQEYLGIAPQRSKQMANFIRHSLA